MNTRTACLAIVCAFAPFTLAAAGNEEPSIDTARIESITGLRGTYTQDEGVFKVTKPRADVAVTVDGRRLDPFQGLASWAAFKSHHEGELMVMGDIVLFQDEVNPVMSTALESGLSVTALHNHFFYESPKVYFMHIGGMGSTETLATGVKRVLDKVTSIRAASPELATGFGGPAVAAANSITARPLQDILGVQGTASNGMLKAVFGRTTSMAGVTATKEMGVNTWAAFAGSDAEAVVDGDFVVLESELQPVLRSLRGSGLDIVAIHNHMTGEEPRMIFLHYWGKGRAVDLARGVKNALALTGS